MHAGPSPCRNTGRSYHPNHPQRRISSKAQSEIDTTPPINRDRQNNAHPRHGDFNCTQKKSGTLSPEFEVLSGWSPIRMIQREAIRARRRVRNQTTLATTSHRAPSSTQATG